MYEFHVLSPQDLVHGFLLSGVSASAVSDEHEVLAGIREISSGGQKALVIVPEEYYHRIPKLTRTELAENETVIVVPVPLIRTAEDTVRQQLEDRVGDILGFRLSLTEKIIG